MSTKRKSSLSIAQSDTELSEIDDVKLEFDDNVPKAPLHLLDISSSYDSPYEYPNAYENSNEQSMENYIQTLSNYGYSKLKTICDQSLQGKVYEGEKRTGNDYGSIKIERVAIKQVSKLLHNAHISLEDGMSFVVEENVIKESLILNYLTVLNKPPADYIVNFIEFFEDNDNFYLVTSYGGNQNLLQFVNKAHTYLKEGRLSIKEWQKTVKYLFWQIIVILNYLHNDLQCAHLDLCLQNILVQKGDFIIDDDDDKVRINPKINVRLCDFGCAELFDGNWKCAKTTLTGDYAHCAPQVYNGEVFDARAADIWQLGCILYHMSMGRPLYEWQDSAKDDGFRSLELKKIAHYLQKHHLLAYVNAKLLKLINGMLAMEEMGRMDVLSVMKSDYFSIYYRTRLIRNE